MKADELRTRIYSRIDTIPTLPAVFPKLLRLMEDDKATTAEVAGTISHDPALASSLLKAANSAYYGFPEKIASLDKAVALLGFNLVKSLALSIGVIHGLPAGPKSGDFTGEGLWAHSLAVATAMEQFARANRNKPKKDYLFVTGLLHDIGKVVLIEFFTEEFLRAVQAVRCREAESLHAAERRVLGLDHGEVGAMLLARWRIPSQVTETIALHHRTEIPEEIDRTDLALLRLADWLARKVGIGQSGNPNAPEFDEDDLRVLGIGEQELTASASDLEKVRDAILDFFRVLT